MFFDEDDDTCRRCNGTGEGMADGLRCSSCGGSGVERQPSEDVDRDDEVLGRTRYPTTEEAEWAGVVWP